MQKELAVYGNGSRKAKTFFLALGYGLATVGCVASGTAQSNAQQGPAQQPGVPPQAALTSTQAEPLRIMTLGDSITAIFRYQKTLREKLKESGQTTVFVGSQGKDDDRHEGHSGWSIGGIEDKLVGWLDESKPNVVLLQIGTNNMNHGLGVKGKDYPPYEEGVQAHAAMPGKTLDEAGAKWGDKTYGSKYLKERIDGVFDKILSHSGKPSLVVAQIPPIGRGNPKYQKENDDAVARIQEFNAMLKSAVEERRKAGKPVALVDNFSGLKRDYGTTPDHTFGDEKSQSGDWVHPRPDALAWPQMGENFYAGLSALLKK
jgi:hypothetical protein